MMENNCYDVLGVMCYFKNGFKMCKQSCVQSTILNENPSIESLSEILGYEKKHK